MSAMVDRVGMRFGAGLSAVVLVAGFAVGDPARVVIPIVAIALGIGAIFGPGKSPMAVAFRALKPVFFANVPADPEPAAPPRFAQLVGFLFLTAAAIAAFTGALGLAWTLTLIVAALQTLLAVTGICVGCEMYLVMKKLGAKRA